MGKETGADLGAFRVQADDSYHPMVATRSGFARGGRVVPEYKKRSSKTVVKYDRLMHKVDAVLAYFQYSKSAGAGQKESIGFKKP